MLSYGPDIMAALSARQLMARDFLRVVARTRADPPAPVAVGFWSDVGNVTAEVVDPDTGMTASHAFYGSGTLISISDIPRVASLTVQTVRIRMSQLDQQVAEAVRVYDVKQARVEIYRGFFDPVTRQMVAPAICRFVGYVDTVDIKTPAQGAAGGVEMACTSSTAEMTRSNTDTRSHQAQLLRDGGDGFFEGVEQAGEIEHFWGRVNGKVPSFDGRIVSR